MMRVFLPVSLLFLTSYMRLDAQGMTLEEAIRYAMDHSLSVQNSLLSIQDADERIIESRAIGLPQVSGTVDYSYYFKVPTSVLPEQFALLARDPNTGQVPDDFSREVQFSLKNNLNLGLNLNSYVFDGSYLVGLRAAKVYREYVQQELKAKQKEVENAVTDAYLPALIITENINILNKNISNLEKLVFETQASYEAGFVEQLDVDRLELSLANLRVEQDHLVRQRQTAIDALKLAMGYPVSESLELKDDINRLLIEATREDLSSPVVYLNRPEYKVAELGVRLNELNVDLFRSGYLPKLTAFASYAYAFQGNSFNDENSFWSPIGILGAQLNIPLYDGGDKRAKVQRARIAKQIAENQTRDLERLIEFEVQTARNNYLSARERVQAQQRNLELAEKIYNTTQIKYKEGVGSSLEINQAEQSLYQTQQNHIQALYDLLVAKAALDKALGT